MTSRGLRYLVCGNRDWSDWALVRRFVDALRPGSTVVHGDARGLDSMVERVLTTNKPSRARTIRVHGHDGTVGRRRGGSTRGDIDIEVYPADWDRYRQRGDRATGEGTEREGVNPAGMIRNRKMLREGLPDHCIYFAHDLSSSPGTANMVEQCAAADIPVWEASEFVAYMQHGHEEVEDDE